MKIAHFACLVLMTCSYLPFHNSLYGYCVEKSVEYKESMAAGWLEKLIKSICSILHGNEVDGYFKAHVAFCRHKEVRQLNGNEAEED